MFGLAPMQCRSLMCQIRINVVLLSVESCMKLEVQLVMKTTTRSPKLVSQSIPVWSSTKEQEIGSVSLHLIFFLNCVKPVAAEFQKLSGARFP